MLDNLILPSRHHLEVLDDLQKYFRKRNAVAKFPGLLEEDEITENSFSVRYASSDAKMIETRKKIRNMDLEQIAEKREEVKAAREHIASLRADMDRLECTCTANVPKVLCSGCASQTEMQQEIANQKIFVHKVSLMPEKYKQNAVVFELCIPDEIACLRDVLYIFVTKHYNVSVGEWEKCTSWTENRKLKFFATGCAENVFLGTSCKYFNTSRTRGSDRISKHPESPPEEFINKDTSDYDCLMFGRAASKQTKKMPRKMSKQSIKKYVTFTVDKSTGYEKLQSTLETTMHTQNSVLASQSECPIDLNITEYVNFGSLRADGHRLQYRNLYRAIVEEKLSFETPSVLALVMQTLWESGPNRAANSSWYRETNEDFMDLNFIEAMVNLLDGYIQRQQRNWQNPLKLMFATFIICRMFELNTDPVIADLIAEVLLKFRSIAISWIPLIQTTLNENRVNESNCGKLNVNLVEVGICGVLTYFVDPHHPFFNKIFDSIGNQSALYAWMHFIATINHNNLLCKDNNQQVRTVCIRFNPTISFILLISISFPIVAE